jgi:hypothetical protein
MLSAFSRPPPQRPRHVRTIGTQIPGVSVGVVGARDDRPANDDNGRQCAPEYHRCGHRPQGTKQLYVRLLGHVLYILISLDTGCLLIATDQKTAQMILQTVRVVMKISLIAHPHRAPMPCTTRDAHGKVHASPNVNGRSNLYSDSTRFLKDAIYTHWRAHTRSERNFLFFF